MKLVVGLGNPGKRYTKTRHNFGFMALEALAAEFRTSFHESQFSGELAVVEGPSGRIFFLKPQTFMNRSGESVAAIAKFYKIEPKKILVIYDDLDLPLGRLRVVCKGSSGGHNGIKSIIEHIGADHFCRLKLGIGRPADARIDVVDYVLMPFAKIELPKVEKVLKIAVNAASVFLQKGPLDAMNGFNGIVVE